MARRMESTGDAFRAKLVFKRHDGKLDTVYEGPYGKIGPAKSRVTFWSHYASFVGGEVEGAITNWEPVS